MALPSDETSSQDRDRPLLGLSLRESGFAEAKIVCPQLADTIYFSVDHGAGAASLPARLKAPNRLELLAALP